MNKWYRLPNLSINPVQCLPIMIAGNSPALMESGGNYLYKQYTATIILIMCYSYVETFNINPNDYLSLIFMYFATISILSNIKISY